MLQPRNVVAAGGPADCVVGSETNTLRKRHRPLGALKAKNVQHAKGLLPKKQKEKQLKGTGLTIAPSSFGTGLGLAILGTSA